jgi:formylmethanofuran dehydrogenase subunit E
MKNMNKEGWDKARAFHGHECPGLAIGFKACEAALEKLGVTRSSDEEVICVTENDACGVDAVQAVLGCSFGKGNLIYRGTGKMAFSFFSRISGKKLRMYFKVQKQTDMSREQYQDYILNAPVDELFAFSEPKGEVPEQARLFPSVVCTECGERAPEHKIRLQNGKPVCLDCFKDYHRGF